MKVRDLQGRWFAALAILAVVAGGSVVWWLTESGPGDGPGSTTAVIDETATMKIPVGPAQGGVWLEQLTPRGGDVPWGTELPTAEVTLRVRVSRPLAWESATFVVWGASSRTEDEPIDIAAASGVFRPAGLSPGPHRWRVELRPVDGSEPVRVEHAVDERQPHFVVPPPLRIESLAQLTMDGSPLPIGDETENGAILTATLRHPHATVLFECSQQPFTGTGLFAAPVTDDEARLELPRPPGSYRWRARARAPDGEVGPWARFSPPQTGAADFVVVAKPAGRPPEQDRPDEAGFSLGSGGGGTREPRPSIVERTAPLWELVVSPALGIAGIIAVAAIVTIALRFWWRRGRRAPV